MVTTHFRYGDMQTYLSPVHYTKAEKKVFAGHDGAFIVGALVVVFWDKAATARDGIAYVCIH